MPGPYRAEAQKEKRRLIAADIGVTWQETNGARHSCTVRAFNISETSVWVMSTDRLDVGSWVQAHADDLGFSRAAQVRSCEPQGSKYVITLDFRRPSTETSQQVVGEEFQNYYEILEVSPSAEPETIQRVYRLLAARYHPDNAQTGNTQKFLLLRTAYEVLSDPVKRAAYDADFAVRESGPMSIFELKEFVVGVDAEKNRRLGMLCLLYNRQRLYPDKPTLSLLQFEQLMTIPREHLMFTVWYLRRKQLVMSEGGADFQITAEGVDFVESALPSNRLLQRLLRAPSDGSSGKQSSGDSANDDGGIT